MPIPRISVCVLACNEAAKIERALASARASDWCDELLVFDSGSTDATVNIARLYADRVEFHEWVDFGTNRRLITEAARNDWVFILDADEQISAELAREVAGLSQEEFARHPVFTVPRRNYLLGRYVRAWSPDRQTRLFDRRRVQWPERSVHDTRIPTEGTPSALRYPLLHNADVDEFGDYFDGQRYAVRTEALARELLRKGRRVGYLKMLLRPLATFLKFYLLKGGFLDGTFGVLVAQKAAFSVQLKYARLWHLQQQGRAAERGPGNAGVRERSRIGSPERPQP